MRGAHAATEANRDAFHVAPNIAIVQWSRPSAGARDDDDYRQKITLAFKELAPCTVSFEFLEYWNGSRIRPHFENLPVNDWLVMPPIRVSEAESDEALPAKIGQVRRDHERNREKYVAIADAICRGDYTEAARLHAALLAGAIETAFIAVRYMQLYEEGGEKIVGSIAREYRANDSTIHRHLKAAIESGRWPRLAPIYPRRSGMRSRTGIADS
jgi:hypothetical protein